MEKLLLGDLAKAAIKEVFGYGLLGVACVVLSYTVYKLYKRIEDLNKKMFVLLDRKTKRKEKHLELEEKVLTQNNELVKSLIESANTQGELVAKLVKLSKK